MELFTQLFNQITPNMVLAGLVSYLYLAVLSTIEQYLSVRDNSGSVLIKVFRTSIYLVACIAGIGFIGTKFGFEDPTLFVSRFTIFYCIISIGIRITSVINMRVSAAPFLAYVYYPSLLIFWVIMSAVTANAVNNLMQLRNCISQLGNLHTFRRLPKWYVGLLNKIYWVGLNINHNSNDHESINNTYEYTRINHARSIGRPANLSETFEAIMVTDVFADIANDAKKQHKDLADKIDEAEKNYSEEVLSRIDQEVREKGYSETAEQLGLKSYSREDREKILDDVTSDKKE